MNIVSCGHQSGNSLTIISSLSSLLYITSIASRSSQLSQDKKYKLYNQGFSILAIAEYSTKIKVYRSIAIQPQTQSKSTTRLRKIVKLKKPSMA